jgi:hypothetical protein
MTVLFEFIFNLQKYVQLWKFVCELYFVGLQILDHINTAVDVGRHRSPDPGVPQVKM